MDHKIRIEIVFSGGKGKPDEVKDLRASVPYAQLLTQYTGMFSIWDTHFTKSFTMYWEPKNDGVEQVFMQHFSDFNPPAITFTDEEVTQSF